MAALGQSVRRTGGCHGGILDRIMSFGGDLLLSGQHLAAAGAVPALGFAFCGTGGGDGRIDHDSVARRRYRLLPGQNLAADGAVTACRQPVFSTSGGHGGVDHFFMTGGRNGFLFDKHDAANRTMLTLRQAALRTGRRHSSVDHFLMAGDGNGLLRGQRLTADLADGPLGQTSFRTGRRFGRNRLRLMPRGFFQIHTQTQYKTRVRGGDPAVRIQIAATQRLLRIVLQTDGLAQNQPGVGGRHFFITVDIAPGRAAGLFSRSDRRQCQKEQHRQRKYKENGFFHHLFLQIRNIRVYIIIVYDNLFKISSKNTFLNLLQT